MNKELIKRILGDLYVAFVWMDTPQGFDYWGTVEANLRNLLDDLKTPTQPQLVQETTKDFRDVYPIGSLWETRDGSKVTIVEHGDPKESDYPLLGYRTGSWRISSFTVDGFVLRDSEKTLDLVRRLDVPNDPPKQENKPWQEKFPIGSIWEDNDGERWEVIRHIPFCGTSFPVETKNICSGYTYYFGEDGSYRPSPLGGGRNLTKRLL